MRASVASRRGIVVGALALCASLAAPFQAHAETPLEAFCADNEVELQRTMHENTLDPATWASDPKNLARFGFSGPSDIDTLYHMIIDTGAPYITSNWSNLSGSVVWNCGPSS